MTFLNFLKYQNAKDVGTLILHKMTQENPYAITAEIRGNMKELKFMNPVFREGINITVRRGVKWCGTENEEVSIINTQYKINKKGKIILTKCKRFKDIKDSDIEDEHDPVCRTFEGLYKVMKKTYPEFGKDEIVTIVKFEII